VDDRTNETDAAEIRVVADKMRSPIAALRVLSGQFRSRVAQSLGAAALLHDDRRATEKDRDAIQAELRQYREKLAATADDVHRLGVSISAAMQRVNATEAEVLEVQRRALAQEKKEKELGDEDRRLTALGEDVGRRHHELTRLFERAAQDSASNGQLLNETREIEEAIRAQLAALDGRVVKMGADEQAFAERRRALSAGEGTLEAGREALRESEARAAEGRARAAEKDAQLVDLSSRLERDQSAVNEMHAKLVGLVQRAHEHEQAMDKHYKELARRLAEQDARAAANEVRAAELDARKLAYDRERVELDGRISQLSDLDQRNEQLLRFKAYLDEDEKRLNAELSGVRENQRLTTETWEELKKTLARIEELERHVEDTNDAIGRLREETERRDRESTEAARRRSLALDAREREILNWRMQSELRERKVQERYNELDVLEQRKTSVRGDIERLEREHASRASEWEREQQRARQAWAERRAEAEKARELYERNAALLDRRLAEVMQREKEHQTRAETLEERNAQLTERERRLRAAEERIRLLEEQRDSLNAVIASLTTQVGRDWPAPESRLESGLTPPPLDAPIDASGATPPPVRRSESSAAAVGSSKPSSAGGGA
jgi:chromosome segregation ATPase